jgi:hypothetical protein
LITNSVVPFGPIKPTQILLTHVLRSENGFDPSPSMKSLELIKKSTGVLTSYRKLMSDSTRSERFQKVLADYTDRKDEHYALAALYAGVSNVAQIDIQENSVLDTHVNHADTHPNSQRARWERVAGFLDGLKKFGLLEKTLVLVTTEFTRTPGLNDNGGKDHNNTDNSVALFGYGINGGRAVGGHNLITRSKDFADAFMVGKFVDFNASRSGRADRVFEADMNALAAVARKGEKLALPDGVGLVRPRDVWATVVSILDSSMAEKLPKGAAALPGIVAGT